LYLAQSNEYIFEKFLGRITEEVLPLQSSKIRVLVPDGGYLSLIT